MHNRLEAAAARRGLHPVFRRSSGRIMRFAIEAVSPAPAPVEEALALVHEEPYHWSYVKRSHWPRGLSAHAGYARSGRTSVLAALARALRPRAE